MVVALTGCGGAGGEIASRLPTALPTALPTLPSRPSAEPSTDPEPTLAPPAESAAPEPTAEAQPVPPPTDTVTSAPTLDPAESSPPDEAAETAPTDEGAEGWPWWALLLMGWAVAAAVAALGVVLVRRRRARLAWTEGLDEALRGATWLGEELLPTMQAQHADARAGSWALGRTRVVALERALEDLSTGSPDPATARRVAERSTVVVALRSALDLASMFVDFGGPPSTSVLLQARRELDDVVGALRPRPEPEG